MSDTLVKVENVSKKFCRSLKKSLWYGMQDLGNELLGRRHGGDGELRPDEFWAVRDVSFELKRGECLGLIGRNGAGKTTLLRMLNGLIKPDTGRIEMRGRVGALIALGAGFNPILTGRENIYVNGAVLGLSKKEIDEKFEEIVEFAELGEFIDTPVQNYSSGMAVRLGFSVAATLKHDILLLDEVLAVGDANFRSKCWRRIGELLLDSAVILVSHEAYAISRIADRGIVLAQGRKKFDASATASLEYYTKNEINLNQQSFCSLHPAIESIELSSVKTVLKPGEHFDFFIRVNVKTRIFVDHAVINILNSGEDVDAQSLFDVPPLPRGVIDLYLSIGPLFLSTGTYSLVILLSTNGGKVPLIHSRNELGFRFTSHPSYGPKYYPPCLIKTTHAG